MSAVPGPPGGGSTPDDPVTHAVSAQVTPQSRLDKILAVVPRALSSHAHIIFLFCLGIFLVVLPLVGVNVSAKAELIGGNYTNVTSDLGACIAAGLTVHLVKRDHRRAREFTQLVDRLHLRYDDLEKSVTQVADAARRAEQAASRQV
jgi:hypothetical protein